MQYTNKYKYPEEIVKLLDKHKYKRESDYSTTELIKPVREAAMLRHNDVQVDISHPKVLFSLLGTLMHSAFENQQEDESDNKFYERRFYKEIEGKVVSGQIDVYDRGVVKDFKLTSVSKFLKGDFEDWEKQGNYNKVLLNEFDYDVHESYNILVFRNFNIFQAGKYSYPDSYIKKVYHNLFPKEVVEDEMKERVLMNIDADKSKSYPLCTDKERMMTHEKYRVKKRTNKKGRIFYSEKEAEDFKKSQKNPDEYDITVEDPVPIKCLYFCDVAHICSQHKEYLKNTEKNKYSL